MALPKWETISRNSEAGSNLGNKTSPANTPRFCRYFEQVYTEAGFTEWLLLPDAGIYKVCISFPTGVGSAQLRGTCSPPDVITGQSPAVTATSPVGYDLSEMVTDTTAILVQGDSAIRLNIGTGPVCLSVRA